MKLYDSHLHIGEYNQSIRLLNNSIYRNKYRLYSSINQEVIFQQEQYTSQLDNFFAIPLFFKESNIQECNQYVIDYCKRIGKGIPVLLLDDNKYFNDNYNNAIFKEHFLLNKYDDYKSRDLFYDFLNQNGGFLLIHSKDNIRIEYLDLLLKNYPEMNIIIAHLGRDVLESYEFINSVLDHYKGNERIFFDISTIHNFNNIQNAIKKIGSSRIIYGTDFPFEVDNYNTFLEEKNKILHLLDSDVSQKIFENNFDEIRKRIYVRKRVC